MTSVTNRQRDGHSECRSSLHCAADDRITTKENSVINCCCMIKVRSESSLARRGEGMKRGREWDSRHQWFTSQLGWKLESSAAWVVAGRHDASQIWLSGKSGVTDRRCDVMCTIWSRFQFATTTTQRLQSMTSRDVTTARSTTLDVVRHTWRSNAMTA